MISGKMKTSKEKENWIRWRKSVRNKEKWGKFTYILLYPMTVFVVLCCAVIQLHIFKGKNFSSYQRNIIKKGKYIKREETK